MDAITNAVPPALATGGGASPAPKNQTCLIFRLGDQDYGVDIRKVQELRHYDALMRIADGSRLVDGVAISRGEIMPLVDVRIPFNPGAPLFDALTEVIVLNLADRSVCMVVDSVSEVVALNPAQAKPIPPATTALDTSGLIGLTEHDQRSIILLDIDKFLLGPGIGCGQKQAA